jgi:hypothetical protein
LGGLPVFAVGFAQFASRPELKSAEQWATVGSVIRIQEQALASIDYWLRVYGWVLIAMGLSLAITTWLLDGRLLRIGTRANIRYFSKIGFLAVSVVTIIIITAALI